jgi:hypothetical protein
MRVAEDEAEAELVDGIKVRGAEPFLKATSDSSGKAGDSHSEAFEPPDWKALAWILERRGERRWGVKKTITLAIQQDREKLLKVVEKTLGSDAVLKLAEAFAAEDDGAAAGRESSEPEEEEG